MRRGRDTLFADAGSEVEDFAFDARVAAVFEDMIRRSVPGYGAVVGMSGVIAGHYAQANSRCYDLGCSLGATTLAMRRHIDAPGVRILAVDNSMAMMQSCREHLDLMPQGTPVDLICADIRDLTIDRASVVVLNFTLQFVPQNQRLELLSRIRAGLLPGGVLVLSEKIMAGDAEQQQQLNELHHAFKRANGYSELEISAKRAALERVLIPDTLETHRARLMEAGFSRILPWMQCLNFVSLLART